MSCTLSFHLRMEVGQLRDNAVQGSFGGGGARLRDQVTPQKRHIHRDSNDAGPCPALLCKRSQPATRCSHAGQTPLFQPGKVDHKPLRKELMTQLQGGADLPGLICVTMVMSVAKRARVEGHCARTLCLASSSPLSSFEQSCTCWVGAAAVRWGEVVAAANALDTAFAPESSGGCAPSAQR